MNTFFRGFFMLLSSLGLLAIALTLYPQSLWELFLLFARCVVTVWCMRMAIGDSNTIAK